MSVQTRATSSPDTQPRSQNFAQRSARLPADMQKFLKNYAGNTEESQLLVLTKLEEDLRNHPDRDLIRVTRKEGTNGRQGGIETATCGDCRFLGTFQKVAEHRTSQHWELALWTCGATACKLKYRRKQDLTRHHSEAHKILGPRRSKKLALQGSQAGQHTASQSISAYALPSTQNQHEQQASYMSMSPMSSRSEPHRYRERPSMPSTLPAPPGSTSNSNGHSYRYQDGLAQQAQSPFTLSPIAGHAIPPYQGQDGYLHAPRMRHDQPRIGAHPFMYAEGSMHAAYEHTPQTVRPHPRHDQATSSIHNNPGRVLSQNTEHRSFGGSTSDDIGYLNEGKGIVLIIGTQSVRFYTFIVAFLRIEIMEWSPLILAPSNDITNNIKMTMIAYYQWRKTKI